MTLVQHRVITTCFAPTTYGTIRELLQARKQAEDLLLQQQASQKAMLEAQSDLQRALEQRATMAEQIVGIVSHDLRTPINAIVLAASLLSSSELSERDRRTLQRVNAAATRATRLVGDLLDFTQARLGAGIRIHLSDVDVGRIVEECVDELRLSSGGRMIEHQDQTETQCRVDPPRLAQVVVNLVNNALTYGDPLRPVQVRTVSRDGQLALSVHNHGTPIPDGLLPHIFEPMRRGESQIKLGSRSVGLGLYIVHEIVVAHGGSVDISSSQGDGTTFSVRIPSASRPTT